MKYSTKGYWATQRYVEKGSKNVATLKDQEWTLTTGTQKRLCTVCGGYTWSGDQIFTWKKKAAHTLCLNNLREVSA